MSKSADKTYALCLNCASIFPSTREAKLVCMSCGFEIDRTFYEKLFEYSKTSVYYGYNYRKYYEKQIEDDGNIHTFASLSVPVTVACFLGMAALSGIIGNIATDIVKKAFKKIMANSEQLNKDIGQNNINITNDTDINIFIQYVKDYHTSEYNTSDEVKYHIVKEEVIDNLSDKLCPTIAQGKPSLEKIQKAVEEALKSSEKTDKLSVEDFREFWKRL